MYILCNLPLKDKFALIGEGNGTPLQYSCLENPMDKEAWQATVQGLAESGTIEHMAHSQKSLTGQA